MNIFHVDHFYIHSYLWESYTFCIFPCINLFFNLFLVRTWNLLHMDVDTISKYQTGVFNKKHNVPFHSLLPSGFLLAMGFTLSHKTKLETSDVNTISKDQTGNLRCEYYIKRPNWCLQIDTQYPLPLYTNHWSLVGHGIYLSHTIRQISTSRIEIHQISVKM